MIINTNIGNIKINRYPHILKDYHIVEFEGWQERYSPDLSYGRKIKNSYAFSKNGQVIDIYHLNAKGSYTPIEDNRLPLTLIKYIAENV